MTVVTSRAEGHNDHRIGNATLVADTMYGVMIVGLVCTAIGGEPNTTPAPLTDPPPGPSRFGHHSFGRHSEGRIGNRTIPPASRSGRR
jgi:hypothetical protein